MLIATPEASPKYDDSYMGYSVAVGDFAGQGEQGVAVGVPRGGDLKGLVSIQLKQFVLGFITKLLSNKLLINVSYRKIVKFPNEHAFRDKRS